MLRTIMIPCTMVLAMGMAHADPLKLTDTQMDMVTAGVGVNNVAFQPWPALAGNGFALHQNANSNKKVGVPSVVPNSTPW